MLVLEVGVLVSGVGLILGRGTPLRVVLTLEVRALVLGVDTPVLALEAEAPVSGLDAPILD